MRFVHVGQKNANNPILIERSGYDRMPFLVRNTLYIMLDPNIKKLTCTESKKDLPRKALDSVDLSSKKIPIVIDNISQLIL